MSKDKQGLDKIYIVTDRKAAGDRFWSIIEELFSAGFTFIQLREKDLTPAELFDAGRKMTEMGRGKDLHLVINDRADVAAALGAYGVQLTEASMPPHIVRAAFPGLKIGLSLHGRDRLAACEKSSDFVVWGNLFETGCKAGVPGKGIAELAALTAVASKPVYAIGGIDAAGAKQAFEAGAHGVAVMSSVFSAADPLAEIHKIKKVLGD